MIVDDHFLVREGLKRIIGNEIDMEVAAEASDYAELMSLLRKNLEFDMIILDISLPNKTGLEILKELMERDKKTKLLMLTMHPEDRYAIRAIKAGALGYLTKKNLGNQVLRAIRKVASGGQYISESLSEKLAVNLRESKGEKLHEKLSDREFQVLQLIGMGKTILQIAEELSVSKSTVHTYKTRIREKMNMSSKAELMHYVIRNDLIY